MSIFRTCSTFRRLHAVDAHLPYLWTIRVDSVQSRFPDDLKQVVVSLAGTVGPEDCPLTSEQIANHPDAKQFRLYLYGESNITHEGFLVGDVGDLPSVILGETEPWRSITAGWDCTIELLKNNVWQKAKYLGMFFDDWTPLGL